MMIKIIVVVLLAISMGVPYAGYRLTGRKKAGGKISLVAGLFPFFGTVGFSPERYTGRRYSRQR